MAALDRANANARQWVVTALANFDLGLGDTKDLADARAGHGQVRAEYLQAVFNYRMGVARLDNAAGRDLDDLHELLRAPQTALDTPEGTP